MNQLIKFMVICIFLMSMNCFADERRKFKYVGWFDRNFKTIIEPLSSSEDGRFVIGSDGINEATFCSVDDDYVCIFSQAYAFSFPKANTELPPSWKLHGVTYQVVRQGISLSLWGREITDAYLIETPRDANLAGRQRGKSTYTLFSRELGVLGFSFGFSPEGEADEVYWLMGAKGFGALQD